MTTWNNQNKSASGVAEVDFVFSDNSDFLFSEGLDFVFVEGSSSTPWSNELKSSSIWNNSSRSSAPTWANTNKS